jgi:pSer/pThr/pTyr-binding forkhead associated (FHA) protein
VGTNIKLLVVGKHFAGLEIPVHRAKFLIGRDKECQLRLHCHRVSRQHCVLMLDKERIFVEDLHSMNGTFVNGEAIDELRELSHGDHLRLGSFECTVRISSERHRQAVPRDQATVHAKRVSVPVEDPIITQREIGIDLQTLDATTSGDTAMEAETQIHEGDTIFEDGDSASAGSVIVCGESWAGLTACDTFVFQEVETDSDQIAASRVDQRCEYVQRMN